jgi:hypothetical protein
MSQSDLNYKFVLAFLSVIFLNLFIEITTFKFKVSIMFGGARSTWVEPTVLGPIPHRLLSNVFTYIGWFQFLYIIPLVFILICLRWWEFMKGVISAAVITALVNGCCLLLFFLSRR